MVVVASVVVLGSALVAGTGSARQAPNGAARVSDPVSYQKDTPFSLDTSQSNYWVNIPQSYPRNNSEAFPLLVWLHGCGGDSSGDIYTVSPGGQDWISIAIGGRDGDCWDVNNDQPKVMAAIADVKTHFNINGRRVILGGYSSGGDLSYRIAFYNSRRFAGVLAENTTPFRDTGSTKAQSLHAAKKKFHIIQLAHTSDEVYPIGTVRSETNALKRAGWPIKRIERPGTHYDNHTDGDLQKLVLPHIDDGWRSPKQ